MKIIDFETHEIYDKNGNFVIGIGQISIHYPKVDATINSEPNSSLRKLLDEIKRIKSEDC